MIQPGNLRDSLIVIGGLLFVIAIISLAAALVWIGLHILWRKISDE